MTKSASVVNPTVLKKFKTQLKKLRKPAIVQVAKEMGISDVHKSGSKKNKNKTIKELMDEMSVARLKKIEPQLPKVTRLIKRESRAAGSVSDYARKGAVYGAIVTSGLLSVAILGIAMSNPGIVIGLDSVATVVVGGAVSGAIDGAVVGAVIGAIKS